MPERINYTALCFTVAIAIFLGNGLLLVVEKAWTHYELKVAAQMLKESSEKMKIESAKRMREMQIQNQEKRRMATIEAANQSNVNRIKRQTCDFWVKEFGKSRTAYNKAMMDSACK